MDNSAKQMETIDVTPRSLFISIGDESYLAFRRNTTIPCQKRIQFQQVHPPTAVLNIYTQDEGSPPAQLTSVTISIPPTGRFTFVLTLDLAIDANGMLTFTSPLQKVYRSTYEEYLDSPTWQTKRQETIARAGHKCQLCGADTRLDVHHNTYERFGGNELPTDLVVLCRSCHEIADKRRKTQRDDDIYYRRVAGWATKIYGEYWEDSPGWEVASERFDEWLESKDDDD